MVRSRHRKQHQSLILIRRHPPDGCGAPLQAPAPYTCLELALRLQKTAQAGCRMPECRRLRGLHHCDGHPMIREKRGLYYDDKQDRHQPGQESHPLLVYDGNRRADPLVSSAYSLPPMCGREHQLRLGSFSSSGRGCSGSPCSKPVPCFVAPMIARYLCPGSSTQSMSSRTV